MNVFNLYLNKNINKNNTKLSGISHCVCYATVYVLINHSTIQPDNNIDDAADVKNDNDIEILKRLLRKMKL